MRNLILICCLAFAKAGLSQTTLSHQVIGSLGSTETVGNVVLEQSLGDLVIVSSNTSDDVASGFQQGRKYIDYIYESSNWRPYAPESNATFIDNFFIKSDGAVLGSAIDIKDITIEGAYTIDLGNFNLSFKGDLSSQNSFVTNGNLVFTGDNGESNRLYTTGINIENFVKDGSDSFTLDEAMTLTNLFTLKNGVLDTANGNLIFVSTSSNTAEIAPNEGGSMLGESVIQRYIPPKRAYRFLASSVNTSGSILENWQENGSNISGLGTHISGSMSGANGFDATQSGNSSMFTYDNLNQGWNAVANTDVRGLDIGEAYRIMIRGDRTVDLTNNATTPTPTTLRAKGAMNVGTYQNDQLSITAGGFNFIANPFQATVNVNTVLQGSNNLNLNRYYVWDPTINTRGAYVTVMLPSGSNVAGSSANEYLQPSQSAFVTTLNNTTVASPTEIIYNQDDIVNGNQTTVFSIPANDFEIIGRLNKVVPGQPLQFLDAWGIFMGSQYTNAVDPMDAPSLGNPDETISIVNGSDYLNIEFRDVPRNLDIIPLNHTNYRHSSYNYQFEIDAIPAGTNVYLQDNHLNTSSQLNEGFNDYQFTVDSSVTGSIQEDRFHLFFTNITLSEGPVEILAGFELYPNPVKDIIHIRWNNNNGSQEEELSYRLINTLGQIIRTGTLDFTGNASNIKDLGNLASGSYFVELSLNDATKTVQVIKE